MLTLLVVVCLAVVGCSDTHNDKPAASARTQVIDETQAPGVLEDGVYPVVLTEEAMPMGDRNVKIVELVNVPVDGSTAPAPDRIRVIARPLLHFRSVTHFDFKFENNECTEVGFQNTDELREYTRNHIGSRLAVVIDNKVITHHKIRQAIESDQVRITCCTVGGGDHLYKHLTELQLAANANMRSKRDE